jgi:hypothetical protein
MIRPVFFLSLSILAAAVEADILRFKNGKWVRGSLIEASDSILVFETESGRTRRFPADSVESCRTRAGDACRTPGDPAAHTLLFLPTAFMPPEGAVDIRGFELFYLTLGYAPGATTSLSAGTFLGFLWTAGIRQQLWLADDGDAAVTAGLTLAKAYIGSDTDPLDWLAAASVTGSRRLRPFGARRPWGVHANAGYWAEGDREYRYRGMEKIDWDYRWRDQFYGGAGLEAAVAGEWSLLAEYATPEHPVGKPFLFEYGSRKRSRTGFLNAAVRYRDQRVFVDAGVLMTLADPSYGRDRPLAFPLVIIGYRFE